MATDTPKGGKTSTTNAGLVNLEETETSRTAEGKTSTTNAGLATDKGGKTSTTNAG
jgi:hypothetical protein